MTCTGTTWLFRLFNRAPAIEKWRLTDHEVAFKEKGIRANCLKYGICLQKIRFI